MVQLGYALSSAEHTPNDLVRYAQRAEEAGFAFALISDYYPPWLDQQGGSPIVWRVKGELSQELPTPAHFAQATQLVCEDDIADVIVCGPDPAKHIEKIQAFAKAGTIMSTSIRLARTKKAFSDFINRKSCQSSGRHYM